MVSHSIKRFYNKYGTDIKNGFYPFLSDNDSNDLWKRNFADFEFQRYKQESTFWKPLAFELYLEHGCLHGKIDRIDQVGCNGECRVVEYKSSPGAFDEEELLFYAYLLSQVLPGHHLL